MNNTFNIKRFGHLVKRQWLEYGKIQLITLGIVAGVILIIYGFVYAGIIRNTFSSVDYTYSSLELNFREPLFIILGMIFLSIAANQHFAPMGQKSKAIIELTLPASTLEKFLIGLLFSVVLTLVSYLILFYLVDLAFVSKLRSMFHHVTVERTFTDAVGKVVTERIEPTYFFQRYYSILPKPFYFLPIVISSIFLLGSIYFNKFHFLKTMISLMVFSGILVALVFNSGRVIFDGLVMTEGGEMWKSGLKLEWSVAIVLIVISVVLWVITYVRLREKEV